MVSQDNRLLPLTPADRSLRESEQANLREYLAGSGGGYGTIAEQAHLRDYLAIVLKRKWLILSLMLVVTSLVAVQMYRLPSIYEAAVTIQIEPKRNILQTKGDMIVTASSDPAYWPTQLKLLENPELARQVVLTLGLHNNPAFLGGQAGTGLVSSIRRIVSRNRAATPAAQEAAVPVVTDTNDYSAGALTPEQLAKLEPYENVLRSNLVV